jgi:hypothetical protein
MKFFLSLILLVCLSANAQNEDCLKLGESLSIKIDSICFSGYNHSAKPTITIIDYGTLPIRGDTTVNTKSGGSSRVFRLNNQILKLVYQGIHEEKNGFKIEKEEVQIFFDYNKPVYVDYKLVTIINERKMIDLKLHFYMGELELNNMNDSVNIISIIEQINRLIDDARN